MKIPESVRIGGIDYQVCQTSRLNNGKQICYGHIDYEKAQIELNPDVCNSPQFQGQVLWHEVLHGIANHANLSIDSGIEENIIDTFAKGIYQVLQDNGKRLFDLKEEQ